jgi:ribulose-5-phosphate 4-epimerase/fuculose-1-phosphate aldolase
MTYTISTCDREPLRDAVVAALAAPFEARGARRTDDVNGLQFVLNPTSATAPRPYRRRSQSVFVISVVSVATPPADLRSFCYTALVRSLSNLLICVVPREHGSVDPEGSTVYFTTPEAGFYHLPYDPDRVFARVWPIATAHYSTANDLVADLPERFWKGSLVVDDIRRHGTALDRLGVLPLPFPLDQVLPAGELHHLYKIFGMTGLSYGNLSARERITEFANGSFWMTARGCDKAHLRGAGKDVLMVRHFDFDRGAAHISMPPDGEPRARVSVDAVEHAMIYHSYPQVGAIVHVHAWMDGIPATHQNFPCGTLELAEEVSRLLATTPDPGRAIVGLKNHGITATGPSLEDIFARFDGHLRTEVPMYA